MTKRYSPAFERNRDPILNILKGITVNHCRVLEIGSGPGQHALYFAENLPDVIWQPSDVEDYLPSIQAWVNEAGGDNLRSPFELDLLSEDCSQSVPDGFFPDVVFNMNVAHIVCFNGVVNLVKCAARILKPGGYFFFYGPWQFRNIPLEPSNARFDENLKATLPGAGIREFETLLELAGNSRFSLRELFRMPANNCAFYFEKG